MKNATKKTAPKPVSGTMNVVLHGMFGLVNSKDGIEVLVPQVDEHVFKAGNWNEELRLKEGKAYKLAGVIAATKNPGFNPAHNVIVLKKLKADKDPKKLFCSIKLPAPNLIHALRRRPTNTAIAAKSNEKLAGQPTDFSHVRVLTYKFKDAAALSLGKPLQWTPRAQDGFVNLHIFSEMEIPASPMHDEAAWKKIVALFPGLKLELSKNTAGEMPPSPAEASEVPGLPGEQLKMLVERNGAASNVVAEGAGGDPCESLIVGGGGG